jgi:hypothetical protein
LTTRILPLALLLTTIFVLLIVMLPPRRDTHNQHRAYYRMDEYIVRALMRGLVLPSPPTTSFCGVPGSQQDDVQRERFNDLAPQILAAALQQPLSQLYTGEELRTIIQMAVAQRGWMLYPFFYPSADGTATLALWQTAGCRVGSHDRPPVQIMVLEGESIWNITTSGNGTAEPHGTGWMLYVTPSRMAALYPREVWYVGRDANGWFGEMLIGEVMDTTEPHRSVLTLNEGQTLLIRYRYRQRQPCRFIPKLRYYTAGLRNGVRVFHMIEGRYMLVFEKYEGWLHVGGWEGIQTDLPVGHVKDWQQFCRPDALP